MSGGRPSKLKRLIEQYGFTGLGAELESHWTDKTESRRSLRDLAEHVNHRLLRAEMTRAGLDPLEGEVANLYRLLTADDVTEGSRTRAKRRLEEAGIDVEQLNEQFVSRQAVHTYLTKHRGVSAPTANRTTGVSAANQIRRLRGRTRRVTETKLDQLRDADRLHAGPTRVIVEVNVICEECGVQYDAAELITSGECSCDRGPIS